MMVIADFTGTTGNDYCECNGCGQFYTATQVIEAATRADPGENMQGGLYRVDQRASA